MKKTLPQSAKAAILLIAPICPKEHPWKYNAIIALNKCDDGVKHNTDVVPNLLSEAINVFVWLNTPQKHRYWYDISQKLKKQGL